MIVNLKIDYPAALRWYRDIDLIRYIGEEQVLNVYQPIHAFIVVYDITQRHSFAVAKRLVDDFKKEARPGAFVVLVGNKTDLESIRKVFFEVSNVAMFIYYASVLHVVNMKSLRSKGFLMVFVENDVNHV